MNFREEKNMGLSWRFQLKSDGTQKTYNKWVDNGSGLFVQQTTTVSNNKFLLVGGTEKASDNVTMMLGFIGWFRTYFQDFCPEIMELVQKPTSYIHSMRNRSTGKIRQSMNKYLTNINVEGISMVYDYRDRKLFTMAFDYSFNLEEKENFTVIRFLQI